MNDNTESYYKALAIIDRIEEIRKEKNIKMTDFGVNLGHTFAYWSVIFISARCMRLNTLDNIARTLDVSLEYLIYGTNKKEYDYPVDVNKIPEYTKGKKIYLSDSQKSIISKIRQGKQKDISMNMFFQIEEKIKENLLNIIKCC